MSFTPESPPLTAESLLTEYLSRFEQRVLSAYETVYDLPKTYVEPEKRANGMLRYADGDRWNPGFGEGLYLYQDGAWTFLNFGTELDPIFSASPAGSLTAAQVGLIDTSVQPGDNVSDLVNDAAYLTTETDPVWTAFQGTGGTISGPLTVGALTSTGIDDNAPSTTVTITSGSEVLIGTVADAGDYRVQISGNLYVDGDITQTGTGGGKNGQKWSTDTSTLEVLSSNTITPDADTGLFKYRAVDGAVTLNLPTNIDTTEAAAIKIALEVDAGGPYTLTVDAGYTVLVAAAPANLTASTEYVFNVVQYGNNITTLEISEAA